jgi:hypothetical protein
MLVQEIVEAGQIGQPHHRHQTRRTDQVRVIENRADLMRCLHLSDAPSEPHGSNCRKSNPAAPQGHSRVTTHPALSSIGGSRFKRLCALADGVIPFPHDEGQADPDPMR